MVPGRSAADKLLHGDQSGLPDYIANPPSVPQKHTGIGEKLFRDTFDGKPPIYPNSVTIPESDEKLMLDRLPLYEELVQYLDANLERLDTSERGLLTPQEIRKDLATTRTPEDKKFLPVLDNEILVMSAFSQHGLFTEYGITHESVEKAAEKIDEYKKLRRDEQQIVPDAYKIAAYAYSHFHDLDKNDKGYITSDDIETAQTQVHDDKEREALILMAQHYEDLLHPYGKTKLPGPYGAINRAMNSMFPKPGIKLSDFEAFLEPQYMNKLTGNFQLGKWLSQSFKITAGELRLMAYENRFWLESRRNQGNSAGK